MTQYDLHLNVPYSVERRVNVLRVYYKGPTSPKMRSARTSHYLVIATVPILWGTFAPAMKILLQSVQAPSLFLINFLSHSVAAMTLLVMWLCDAGHRRIHTRHSRLGCLELGVWLFGGQTTQIMGLVGTTAAVNAMLVQTAVIIVPLIQLYRNRVSIEILIPSFIALVGVYIMVSPHGKLQCACSSEGIALSLTSAAFYAAHTLRLEDYSDVPASTQALGQVSVNAILDIFALLLSPQATLDWFDQQSTQAILYLTLAVFWNGVCIVGFTTWAMSFAQQHVNASIASMIYASEPFFAAFFAVCALHEQIEPYQFLGVAIVVCATVAGGTLTSTVSDQQKSTDTAALLMRDDGAINVG